MAIIEMTIDQVLDFRKKRNCSIYMTDNKERNSMVDIFVQAEDDILIHTTESKHSPKVKKMAPYANMPIRYYDKRIVTHNFGNPTSWPVDVNGVPQSEFKIEASPNKKFLVSFIQVRFPKRIKLKNDNKLCFSVNLFIEQYNAVVPVVSIEYASVKDIVKKSNTPVTIPFDIVEDMSSEKMIEIQFKYANPDNLEGSPIVLNSSQGEYIKMWLSGNIHIKDINDDDMLDETWAVINGKETIEF